MSFGYIEINGVISQVFVNKSDKEIQEKVSSIKPALSDLDVTIEWDNFYTDKTTRDIIEFVKK